MIDAGFRITAEFGRGGMEWGEAIAEDRADRIKLGSTWRFCARDGGFTDIYYLI